MPDDADILSELEEIDDIVGEEVTFDEATLDFSLEEEDNLPQQPPAVQPPSPRPAEKPAEKARAVDAKPKAKRGSDKKAVVESAAGSVTEVDEVVVRAKKLRIIADKVIIEPGDISFR